MRLFLRNIPTRLLRQNAKIGKEPSKEPPPKVRVAAESLFPATENSKSDAARGSGQYPGRPDPGTNGPLPTGRADLTVYPTCCPLFLGLAHRPIIAGPVSGRGFPIRLLVSKVEFDLVAVQLLELVL